MPEYHGVDTAESPRPSPAASRAESFSSRTEVDLGACTHRGKVRPNNEDHFLVASIERTLQPLLTSLPPGQIPDRYSEVAYGMLIADGLGGATAGEVASREAIAELLRLAQDTPDWVMRFDNEHGVNEVLRRMDRRFGKIREALLKRMEDDPTLQGMDTTLTLAVSLGIDLIIAHIGDSRAYLFHKGRLHLLTRDHTLAQDLADSGVIRPDEVPKHYARHVLTGSVVTHGEQAQVELCQVWLSDGDQLLLCTDGLTDMLSELAIGAVLERAGSAADACHELVERALEAGGQDNVTVVLARYRLPAGPDG
jgi:PPM family protein phosphatase